MRLDGVRLYGVRLRSDQGYVMVGFKGTPNCITRTIGVSCLLRSATMIL